MLESILQDTFYIVKFTNITDAIFSIYTGDPYICML